MSEEVGKSQNALDEGDERAAGDSHENDDELHAWCILEETVAESANRTRRNEESGSHQTAERALDVKTHPVSFPSVTRDRYWVRQMNLTVSPFDNETCFA